MSRRTNSRLLAAGCALLVSYVASAQTAAPSLQYRWPLHGLAAGAPVAPPSSPTRPTETNPGCTPGSVTFSTVTYTWTTWRVPDGCTVIDVSMSGAGGGGAARSGDPVVYGGTGGLVTATIVVAPNSSIGYVTDAPGQAKTINGDAVGSGGGSTSVRYPASGTDRIVAGGGGGVGLTMDGQAGCIGNASSATYGTSTRGGYGGNCTQYNGDAFVDFQTSPSGALGGGSGGSGRSQYGQNGWVTFRWGRTDP